MTKLGLRPYGAGDSPAPGTVPVSVVVLTCDEESNIRRCLASVQWADQVVVVDSGSTDDTVPLARSLGAEIVEQPWLGFSAQREFALRLPELRHDWVYFVDADEWVSPAARQRDRGRLQRAGVRRHTPSAFGWSSRAPGSGTAAGTAAPGSSDSSTAGYTKYDGSLLGERACVDGPVQRLQPRHRR